MKAYMLRSEKRIEPFGDHPSECLVTNRRLRDLQQEVLQQLDLQLTDVSSGAQVEDTEEHIVFDDSLLFTKELLGEFIARSRELQRCTVCALKLGLATLRSVAATQEVQVHADRVEYELRYLPTQEHRGEPVSMVVDPGEESMGCSMPEHMFGTPEYHVAMTDKVLVQIDHWVNVWAANMIMLLVEKVRLKNAPPEYLMELVQKAGSMNQWDILCQTNRIGENCDIHPTAYIEGSTIGDNVGIGAGAVIRQSSVGNGAFICNSVTMELAVAGERTYIGNGTVLQVSLLYPGAVAANRAITSSICGRDTFLGEGVVLTDFRFDGKTVSVLKGGVQVDTGNPMVGACLGHGVYLGGGCIVAPGRSIPNGLRLVPGESRVIQQFGPNEEVPGYQRIDV